MACAGPARRSRRLHVVVFFAAHFVEEPVRVVVGVVVLLLGVVIVVVVLRGPLDVTDLLDETDDLLANARRKLTAKRLDLLVANDVLAPGAGFQYDTNEVIILRSDGVPTSVPLSDKRAVARAVSDLEAAGITATARIQEGKPADVLIAVAKELDASTIIVGTVGENPISGALLGSVVLKLVQRSSIPLLVVPTDEG